MQRSGIIRPTFSPQIWTLWTILTVVTRYQSSSVSRNWMNSLFMVLQTLIYTLRVELHWPRASWTDWNLTEPVPLIWRILVKNYCFEKRLRRMDFYSISLIYECVLWNVNHLELDSIGLLLNIMKQLKVQDPCLIVYKAIQYSQKISY